MLILNRPPGTFETAYGIVGIQANNELVSQVPRFFQIVDVAQMEDIKAAIGKHHFLPLSFPFCNLLFRLRKGFYFVFASFPRISQELMMKNTTPATIMINVCHAWKIKVKAMASDCGK